VSVVVSPLDRKTRHSKLSKKQYQGHIPRRMDVDDRESRIQSGEVDEAALGSIFDHTLNERGVEHWAGPNWGAPELCQLRFDQIPACIPMFDSDQVKWRATGSKENEEDRESARKLVVRSYIITQ
jgi:hypothetical protein